MKKIFTLLAAAAMSVSALTVNAEKCPFSLMDYSGNYLASLTSEITKNDDGSYTIDNFMNSGKGFTFSFPELEKGESAVIETNDYVIDDDGYTYFNSDGTDDGYYTFNLTKYGTSDPYTIYDPCFYNYAGYTQITRNTDSTAASYGYEYSGIMTIWGYTSEDYSTELEDWVYLYFYFGEVSSANAEECISYLKDYDGNYLTSTITSEITKNDDGSYTIENFMNSGKEFTFSFPELEQGKKAEIVTDDYIDDEGYYYFCTGDGAADEDYYTFNLTEYGTSDPYTIYDPCFYPGSSYSYIKRNSASAAASSGYEYYGMMTIWGYTSEDYSTTLDSWIYLYFYFGEVSSTTNVNEIATAENDAPVEYYNLSGLRVENPANGLYIRKQGSEVKKVVIK